MIIPYFWAFLALLSSLFFATGVDLQFYGPAMICSGIFSLLLCVKKWREESDLYFLFPLFLSSYFLGRAFFSEIEVLMWRDVSLISLSLVFSLLFSLKERKPILLFLGGLFLISLLFSFWGLFEFFFSERELRVATFKNKNYFAHFLLMSFFLSLPLWKVPWKGKRFLLPFSHLLSFSAILTSFSFSCSLSLFVGGIIFLFFAFPEKRKWISSLSFLGVALLFLLFPYFGEELSHSLRARVRFLSFAWEIFLNHFWLGGGSQSFSYLVFPFRNKEYLYFGEGDIVFVHNEYAQIAVDYGLIGVLLLGIFLFWHFSTFVKVLPSFLKKSSDSKKELERWIKISSLVASLLFLFQIFFSFLLHVLPNLLIGTIAFSLFSSSLFQFRYSSLRISRILSFFLFLFSVFLLSFGILQIRCFALPDLPKIQSEIENLNSETLEVEAKKLEKSLSLFPTYEKYHWLGETLRTSAQLESNDSSRKDLIQKAIDSYKISIERHPYSYLPLLGLARAYTDSSKFREAELLYFQVLKEFKGKEFYLVTRFHLAENYFKRANASLKKKNLLEAKVFLEQARSNYIRVQKHHGEFFYRLSRKRIKIINQILKILK